MLVFKDTILGLVAGVKLSANSMLHDGDWITIPSRNVNGIVKEVTLTTVKVQNYDNTIVTVPPYALVSESFQNWRGMQQSGGRRVMRSLNIDMNTIRFCTPEEMERYEELGWLEGFTRTGHAEVNLHVSQLRGALSCVTSRCQHRNDDYDTPVATHGQRTPRGTILLHRRNRMESL